MNFFLVKKLQQLHDKHLTRPDFDENSSEEKEIESITKDITAVNLFFLLLLNQPKITFN
jgi:hypothetical protein